jgi:hypothetical protein
MTPAEFDSFVVGHADSIVRAGRSWGTLLAQKQFVKLKPKRLSTSAYMRSTITSLDSISNLVDYDPYLFQFRQGIDTLDRLYYLGWRPFEELSSSSPQALYDSLYISLVNLSDVEAEMGKRVDKVREDFCRRYNLDCSKR